MWKMRAWALTYGYCRQEIVMYLTCINLSFVRVKDELELKGSGVSYKTSVGTDTSDHGSEFSNLSPYGIVSNGTNTGEGNGDPTSPQWGISYIKTEGEDESYDDPMNVVPKTPQS
ncbi:histone H3 acetylation [Desmophyllum pertusum]|uniref:Histone H3 acetylation n=1 Tax=Desmophyllum pertusum TaxID=174260 RepID=A0A9W9YPB4_9CNID|nr:histone H3 acetylation [Desmophyllum pertusum]